MAKAQIDIPLSEEVAKKAGQKIGKLKKELEDNKDAFITILKDMLADERKDAHKERKIHFGVHIASFLIILVLVFCLFKVSTKSQTDLLKQAEEYNKQWLSFMEGADLYTEVELLTDNESLNFGNISLTK